VLDYVQCIAYVGYYKSRYRASLIGRPAVRTDGMCFLLYSGQHSMT